MQQIEPPEETEGEEQGPELFDSFEEAKEAGKAERSLIQLSWRNDEERDALLLAANHGNRAARRHRGESGRAALVHEQQKIAARNKKAAKRRKAKKARRG